MRPALSPISRASRPHPRTISSLAGAALLGGTLIASITAVDYLSKDHALQRRSAPAASPSNLTRSLFGRSRKRFENAAFSFAAVATIAVVSLSMSGSNPFVRLPCPGKPNHDLALDDWQKSSQESWQAPPQKTWAQWLHLR